MSLPAHIATIITALDRAEHRLRGELSKRRLAERIRTGHVIRIGRSGLAESEVWSQWHPQQRHLAAVLVAHRESRSAPIFSHVSAAALLGLPLWGFRGSVPHVLARSTHARTGALARHVMPVSEAELVEIAGIRCTAPDRTLFDLAAREREELLVGVADAHVRGLARSARRVDEAVVLDWRGQMLEHAQRSSGRRGVQKFRRIVGLADPRADSPLESVSRLHFHRLDIDVEPQFEIPNEGGGTYYVDFRLLGQNILGECDGAQKYLDPQMLGARTPGEAVLREKRRDDWISGYTRGRMIHWGARDVRTTDTFAQVLRRYGVHVPLRRRES
ncbi:hypothetical protein PQI23_08100 [Leucobacter sp. USCH14]|uniref:hypothetical protein n=1 Tax=Leucobacter sp. USCH14 TaxID=3024838 RepID=UPI00309E78F5